MAAEASSGKNVATDMTFLVRSWEVLEQVFVIGKVDLCIFMATIAVAVLVRSTSRHWATKKPNTSGVSKAISPRTRAPKSAQMNFVAQLAEDSIAMRSSTINVLSRYTELKARSQLQDIEKELAAASSPHSVLAFFQSLVQCAARGGQPDLVENLIDDMEEIGCVRSVEFYESAMRQLAAKKCFKDALAIHDRLDRDGLTASAVTQSCLVSFSAELGLDDKTIHFFGRLCETGPPSVRACMVVLRVHAKRQNWDGSAALIRSMIEKVVETDCVCLNIALATGVAAGKVREAQAFLSEASVSRVADVISFNTILKGLAQKGLIDDASSLFEAMEKHGVQANIVTYNTMIDGAVRARMNNEAWRLYGQMQQRTSLKPDKCTCSTLVKALQHRMVTPKQLQSVLELATDVVESCQSDLARRLLGGILDAAFRISDLRSALRVKDKILEKGFTLSEADARSIAQLQKR